MGLYLDYYRPANSAAAVLPTLKIYSPPLPLIPFSESQAGINSVSPSRLSNNFERGYGRS